MLISHRHRFIFIHVDKAAGSSLQDALAPFADNGAVSRVRKRLMLLGPVNRISGLHRFVQFSQHAAAEEVRRCLPAAQYSAYFKFGFVRNPWDRLVSRYHYLKRNTSHRHSRLVNAMSGFPEYVRWEMDRNMRLTHQHAYLCDKEGRLIVDFVGRFENLRDDFVRATEKIGITTSLPHLNATESKDYRKFYTPELRDTVADFYKRDIELFGYDFDRSAASAP
jgi:hypothetical protein